MVNGGEVILYTGLTYVGVNMVHERQKIV